MSVKRCRYCLAELEMRGKENNTDFARRQTCNLSCSSKQSKVDAKIRAKKERDAAIRNQPPA